MGKRTHQDVSVTATGVQSSSDRFGKRRRYDDGAPAIAQWRSNLTGLSQVHNLYFIAYGQDIHVTVPSFPTQAIRENPVLILTSQPSRTGLTGYLDSRSPHSINNLIVQNLGNEEVVAVVRDDGDTDAFLVRHVVQAIERRQESVSTIGTAADEVRPFFQSNVGISAWGLAIHSQARIIATSSNKHEIRVFKFGLLHVDEESSDEDVSHGGGEEEFPEGSDGLENRTQTQQRKQDVELHVIIGESNIPNIGFCNTGDDPDARWLLTTDIGGFCRVMDLHKLVTAQTFRFGHSFASPNTGGFDRLNAGWSIMFLDKRSFQPAQDMNTALGLHDDHELPGIKRSTAIWDISKTVPTYVPDAWEPFVHTRSKKRPEGQEARDISSSEGHSVNSSETHSRAMSVDPTASSDLSASVDIEVDVDDGEDDDDGGVEIDINDGGSDAGDENEATTPEAAFIESDPADNVYVVWDDIDPNDEGTEDSTPFTSYYGGTSVCGNEPRFARPSGVLCNDLPCPILHGSVRNIYMLQPSDQKAKRAWMPPMVGLANPLRQPIQQDFEYLRMFERLNMSAYIPALGIVILASQKGRALVLALARVSSSAKYPSELVDLAGKKTNYAMRVKCILPFGDQEKQNQRPQAPLHGLAVSPLQGHEDAKDEQKRWRIMMMYQDHSILSYEVGRDSRSRDSGVNVESLVV